MLEQWTPGCRRVPAGSQSQRRRTRTITCGWRAFWASRPATPAFFLHSVLPNIRSSKCRRRLKLNPQNGPALSDLGDYYAQAPGIAGGGTDKAQAIASQLDKVDAARAAQLRGDIAMASKRLHHGRTVRTSQAAPSAPSPPTIGLCWPISIVAASDGPIWTRPFRIASLRQRRTRTPGVALYDGAGVLIAAKRNPSLAAPDARELSCPARRCHEEAPAFIAHIRLSRLKQQLGDAAGAKQELATAAADGARI